MNSQKLKCVYNVTECNTRYVKEKLEQHLNCIINNLITIQRNSSHWFL